MGFQDFQVQDAMLALEKDDDKFSITSAAVNFPSSIWAYLLFLMYLAFAAKLLDLSLPRSF